MGTILLINYSKAYNNLHAKYEVNCIYKTGSNVIHNYLPNRTHWKKNSSYNGWYEKVIYVAGIARLDLCANYFPT